MNPNIDLSLSARARMRLIVSIASLFGVCLASAQTTTNPSKADSGNILQLNPFTVTASKDQGYLAANAVSATRLDTAIADLPFSVSAFTGQFMRDQNSRDLFDIVQYAAGVTSASNQFGSGNTQYTIRGFTQNVSQRDGFALAPLASNFVDTVDIDRVEVVKGPASLLYGQVTPGGMVNYITKKPLPSRFYSATAQFGNLGFYRGEIDVNQPLVPSQLLFRINAAQENQLEWARSHATTGVIAPKLEWNISDRTSLLVDYQYFHRLEDPPVFFKPPMSIAGLTDPTTFINAGSLTYFPMPKDFNYASNNDYRDTEFKTANIRLTTTFLENWTLRLNYTWEQSYYGEKMTGAGAIALTPPVGVSASDFASMVLRDPLAGLQAASALQNRRARLQEGFGGLKAYQAELVGKIQTRWGAVKPLLGVFHNQVNSQLRIFQVAGYFPSWNYKDPASFNYDTDFNPFTLPVVANSASLTKNDGVYLSAAASLFDDRLQIVGGDRYNRASSETRSLLATVQSVPQFVASRATPSLGVGYKLRPDVMIYGSYSTSFVQNASSLIANGQPTGSAKPTTSDGYEVGVKTSLLGGKISSTVSLYQIDQRDRILTFFSTVDGNSSVQGTVDRSRGLEAEFVLTPLPNWQIFLSASTGSVKVTKVNNPILNPYLGATPPNVADTLANVWTRYTFTSGLLKGLWIGGGANYTGEKTQLANNPRVHIPAYTLWNSAAGYDWTWDNHPMSAQINWKNMTNREALISALDRGQPERVVLSLNLSY